jgi:hypothetical protein
MGGWMDVVVSKQGSEHVCVCRPLVRSNVKRRSSQQLFLLFLAFCFSPALAVNLVFLRRPACLLPQLLESRLPSFTSFFKSKLGNSKWIIQIAPVSFRVDQLLPVTRFEGWSVFTNRSNWTHYRPTRYQTKNRKTSLQSPIWMAPIAQDFQA